MKWMSKEKEIASEEGRRRAENVEDVVRVQTYLVRGRRHREISILLRVKSIARISASHRKKYNIYINQNFINYNPYLLRQVTSVVKGLSYKQKQLQIIFKNILKLFKLIAVICFKTSDCPKLSTNSKQA